MKLKEIIRAPKRVSDYGKWATGDIDRAHWPLKRKKLKQSKDWSWRVIQMEFEQRDLRILLKLNASIEQFYAMLGEVRADTIAVLCSHDLHVTSRKVVWLLVEQLRLEFVPVFHRLQGRSAAQR